MTDATAVPDMPKSLSRRFLALSAGYWGGARRWQAGGLLLGLVLLSLLQVTLAIRLNVWNADLFDALERRSMERFSFQIAIFAGLVGGIMLVNMLHLHLKRRLQYSWRQWLTGHVVEGWMAEARHYQIALLPGDHGNPDGRIAEDIRIATEYAIELAHSGFYCLLLFFSFVSILWGLSGILMIPLNGMELALPGHMVWLSLLYAGGGSLLAMLVGGRLVTAANERQTAEADFRFGLVRARENTEAIALTSSEPQERRRLVTLFDLIRTSWNDQSMGLGRLMLFSSAYSTLAAMFPILVSSPRYLAGAISLGTLMQIAQAFQQITAALSWPVDNFPRIAEWRASVERVLSLQDAIERLRADIATRGGSRIQISPTAGPALAIRDVSIASPAGTMLATGINAEIQPGERVLIAGDDPAGQLLFKAVAGIWFWGSGRIELPDNATVLFMPRNPYLPRTTLRAVLADPLAAETVDPAAAAGALERVGLARLAGELETDADWDQRLSLVDQQRLACARLLLRRPGWIFMAEATEALEPEDEIALLELILSELPQATLVTLGHRPHLDRFHHRKLELECRADRAVVIHETTVRAAPDQAGGPKPPPGRLRRLLESIQHGLAQGD